jgi:hypothetical protein
MNKNSATGSRQSSFGMNEEEILHALAILKEPSESEFSGNPLSYRHGDQKSGNIFGSHKETSRVVQDRFTTAGADDQNCRCRRWICLNDN